MSLRGTKRQMSEVAANWLAREVEDLLHVGSVGLYEFMWLLRPIFATLTDDEMQSISVQVLDRLLEVDGTRLVQLMWPGEVSVGEVECAELRADCWQTPREQTYPALVRD